MERLRPLEDKIILVNFTAKGDKEKIVKTSGFSTYEDAGWWLVTRFDKIDIVNIYTE